MLPQALFLDRDGTLIKHVHYLAEPDQVELLPGVAETLAEAKEAGCRLFLHTNQSGVGRGYFAIGSVEACNRRLVELVGLGEALFDGVCIATEDPTREPAIYRKPMPRFAQEMAEKFGLDLARCWYVGDSACDVDTGLAVGARSAGLYADAETKSIFEERGAAVFPSVAALWAALKRGDA